MFITLIYHKKHHTSKLGLWHRSCLFENTRFAIFYHLWVTRDQASQKTS